MATEATRDLCCGSIEVAIAALGRVHQCADLDVRDDLRAERIEDMPRAVALAEKAAAEAVRYAHLLPAVTVDPAEYCQSDTNLHSRIDYLARRVADVRTRHDDPRLGDVGFHANDAAKVARDCLEICQTGAANPRRWGYIMPGPSAE